MAQLKSMNEPRPSAAPVPPLMKETWPPLEPPLYYPGNQSQTMYLQRDKTPGNIMLDI